MQLNDIGQQVWSRCCDVSAALIAALWPGRDFPEVSAWIDRASPPTQRGIVLGTLLGLFLASLAAAQFGLIGMCLFWMLVIWLIR